MTKIKNIFLYINVSLTTTVSAQHVKIINEDLEGVFFFSL